MFKRHAPVAIVIIVGIGLVFFQYSRRYRAVAAQDRDKVATVAAAQSMTAYSHPDFRELQDRIAHQIRILAGESTEESLANLNRSGAYYWPGPISEEGGFEVANDVSPRVSVIDMERILSSRRFHKVYFELQKWSVKDSSAALKRELTAAVDDYSSRVSAFLDHERRSFESNRTGEIALTIPYTSIKYENGESVAVDITGARLKVLAIALLMGLSECGDCQPDVERVLQIANDQHRELVDSAASPQLRTFGIIALGQVGLYSPSVLTTSLAGVRHKDADGPGFESRSFQITMYDAEVSWFDFHRRIGAVRVDDRKGAASVRTTICTDTRKFSEWLHERE